jgi:outer membrane autotransporter protein
VNFATGRSDVLNVEAHAPPVGEVAATGGKIDGSTGIIVHVVGAAPTALNDTGITLVTGEDANPSSMQCFGRACKTGDTFFISPFSPSYIDVNGIGAVQDGMYAYYLTEVGDPHYALKSTFAPTAAQAPNLITGAQNIWYDSSGVVEDHIYGNHFPLAGAGGGGADLPESAGVAAPGEAAGNRSGLWARMSGGWDSRNTTVSDSVLGSVDTGFSQSTFEVLGGGDFSPSGIAGPFRFGVFGGYTTSSLDFSSFGASADYKGGVLGGYAAYTNGGYYADAQVTWDPLSLTYHMPFGDVSSNAKSLGVLANTGYRMQHGAYFVEPIASLAYVDTRLDDFSAGGASVDFSNGESLRAGAGGRVGTSFATWGGTMTEVSVLGKLWNEFESANKVTVTDGLGHSSTFTSGISGVFGELSASASIYTADRSVSGFVSGGAQFGADFTNWEAKAGIRKTF